jgi:hypothetical protein
MVPARPRTTQAKRLFAALFSTFVAAGAMAYATGGGQHRHDDEAPHGVQAGGAGSGSGDVEFPTQTADGAGGGDGPGAGPPQGGSQVATGGAPHGAYGPGDGQDGSPPPGFMPNGEDGLTLLADYAGRGAGAKGDDIPGLPPAIPDGPSTGGPAGEGGSPVGSDGGFGGSGFGGGGGSGGGGGGSPGGGGGSPPGGGPTAPGAGSGDGGGLGSGSPPGGFPGPGGGVGGHDTGGGKVCVVNCTSSPADGPLTEGFDNPPGGSDGPGDGLPPAGGLPAGGVPEPAAWLMMGLGFGAVGSALRAWRRRSGATFA